MKFKELIGITILFFLITSVFFYKTIFHGYIPFPGDLLISEYNPWKSYSFLGYNPGGYPNKGQYFDVIRQMYPWKTLVVQSFKQGQFPLWNPYNFSGTPLFANFQSAVLYPLNICYFFLPQIFSWTFLIFLQPFLAGLFTYFFTRKIGLSKIASVFSGVFFAFSSFLSVWLEYNTVDQVIAWLPLLLLSTEHLLEKKKLSWILLFVFSCLASLFGGHPQIFIYVFLFAFFYMFHRIVTMEKIKNRKKSLFFFCSLFLLALGMGAIQIIPGIELINLSARSSHNYTDIMHKILIQPWQLLMMIVPDFFGNPATRNYWLSDTYVGKVTSIGIVPLFFVFLTFSKWKNLLIRFFLGAALFMVLVTTANPLTSVLYKINIPFFSSSSPTLGIFLFCFSLSILAGFGIDIFQKEKISMKKFLISTQVLFMIFISLWLFVFFAPKIMHANWLESLASTKRNLLYTTGIYVFVTALVTIAFFKKKILYGILVLLLVVQIFDSWRFFQKFNPFVPKELAFPQTPVTTTLQNLTKTQRFWGYGAAHIEANFATQYTVYSPEGYDPLYPKQYGAFIQAAKNGKISSHFTDQTRSDSVISSSQSLDRQKVLNILGTTYILDTVANGSTEKTFPPEEFTKIFTDNDWSIYKNLQALPRAFIVSQYTLFHSDQEFSDIFFTKAFNPQKAVLLENKLPETLSATASHVAITAYTPSLVHLQTQTNGNGLLFLSDTFYPGWKAFVDKKEVPIYRADYAFRAILVPQGQHEVIFTFDSTSFKIGSIISCLSILTLIGWLVSLYMQDITKAYAKK